MQRKQNMTALLVTGLLMTGSVFSQVAITQVETVQFVQEGKKGSQDLEIKALPLGKVVLLQDKQAELGVRVTEIDRVLAEHLDLKVDEVILLQGVMQGKAAQKAGLRKYDVITAINGKPIVTRQSLKIVVQEKKPGEVISFDFLRRGRPQQIEVTLGQGERVREAEVIELQEVFQNVWPEYIYTVGYPDQGGKPGKPRLRKKKFHSVIQVGDGKANWTLTLPTTKAPASLLQQLQKEIKELRVQVARLAKLLDRLGKK